MWIDGARKVGSGDLQGEAQSRKAGRRLGLFIRGKWYRRDEVGATCQLCILNKECQLRKGREWCSENRRVTCPRVCNRREESDSSALKV